MANPQLPFSSEYSNASQTTATQGGETQESSTSAGVTISPLAGSLTISSQVPTPGVVMVSTPQTGVAAYGSGKPRRVIIRGKIAHEQSQG
jgi:hypothetical protein